MANYINPNDIAAILNSIVKAESEIAKQVATTGVNAKNIKEISDIVKESVKTFKAIIDYANIIVTLDKSIENISKIDSKRINLIINKLQDIIVAISKFSTKMSKNDMFKNNKSANDNLKSTIQVINDITAIIKNFSAINVSQLMLMSMSSSLVIGTLKHILVNISSLDDTLKIVSPTAKNMTEKLVLVKDEFNALSETINTIADTHVFKSYAKITLLPVIFSQLLQVMQQMNALSSVISKNEIKDKTKIIDFIHDSIKTIVDTLTIISNVKNIVLISFSIKKLIEAINALNKLMMVINVIKADAKTLAKMSKLKAVAEDIKAIMLKLTLAGLLSIAFLIVSPAIGLALVALATIVTIINIMPVSNKTLKNIVALTLISIAMITLSLTLVVLSAASALIDLKGTAIILMAVSGLAVMTALIGLVAMNVAKGSLALIALSIAIAALGVSMLVLGVAAQLWSSLSAQDVLVLLMFIGGVAAIAAIAGAASLFIIMGAAALIALSVALMSLSLPLMALAGVMALINKVDVEAGVEKMKALITGVIDAVTGIFEGRGIGGSAKLMLEITGAMVIFTQLLVVSGSIAALAAVVRNMANMTVDEFDASGHPTGRQVRLSSADITNATDNIKSIVSAIVNALTDKEMLERIDDMSFLAPIKMAMLFNTATKVSQVAKLIQDISRMTVPTGFDASGKPTGYVQMTPSDMENVSVSIANIMTTLLNALTNPELVANIEAMSVMAAVKMRIVLDTASDVGDIVKAIKDISTMQIPVYGDDGKVTGYKTLTEADREAAVQSIASIMTTLLNALSDEALTKQLDDMSLKAHYNMEMILDSCTSVGGLVTAIKDASTFDETTLNNGVNNLKAVISNYVNMLDSLFVAESHLEFELKRGFLGIPYLSAKRIIDNEPVASEDHLNKIASGMTALNSVMEPLSKVVSTMKSMASTPDNFTVNTSAIIDAVKRYQELFDDNNKLASSKQVAALSKAVDQMQRIQKVKSSELKANTDNFIRFIDKANSIDTSKVKTVTEMFREMAEFSKSISGDFEELADVLNDKILDALDKIHGAISNAGAANVPMHPGESFAEANTAQAEREAAAETSAPVDLTEIENQLEEIVSALSYLKSNGIKTHQQYI